MHNYQAYESSDCLARYAHLNIDDETEKKELDFLAVVASGMMDELEAQDDEFQTDDTFLDNQEEQRVLAIVGMDSKVLDELEAQDDLWLRCKEIDKPQSHPMAAR